MKSSHRIYTLMRVLSTFVSVLFHPILLNFLLVTLAFFIDRYSYYFEEVKSLNVFLFMSFFILVLFPLVGTAVFKGLGVIPNWHMPDKKDRIATLLITMVFYIWFFINVKNNVAVPDTLVFIALGSTIAIGLSFFINNFSKISLHAVGAGAFLMGMILLTFHTQTSYFEFNLPFLPDFYLSSIFVLFVSVFIAGAVGSARLFLGQHHLEDILGGYVVGIIAEIAAYNIII